MLKLLTEQLAQGKRVFVVVGASHVVMQEPAIRSAVKAKGKKVVSYSVAPGRRTASSSAVERELADLLIVERERVLHHDWSRDA